jgi:hypothetical protein
LNLKKNKNKNKNKKHFLLQKHRPFLTLTKGGETAGGAAAVFYRADKRTHAPDLLGNALSQARVQHSQAPQLR